MPTDEKDGRDAVMEELLAEIDAALAANMTISRKTLAEIAELKDEIERHCRAGNTEKARRMAEVAVSIVRTGEPAKE